MQTVNLIQGSDEWHAHRAKHFNASDAPAMMGCSPYKRRNQLLHETKTGLTAEVDAATLRRFDDGHRYEALARTVAERLIGDDLYPVTGTNDIYSASFDGITMSERVIFEHKSLNDELRNIITDDATGYLLPLCYRVQMEQQCMVSGADRALFMASTWDADDELVDERHCWYYPDLDLRARIIAGWNQFADDLASYVPQEIIPAPVATPQAQLPAVSVQVLGSIEVRDNLTAFGDALRAYVERIDKNPETDQDFADLEASCKTLKNAEEALDAAENNALGQASSIDQMRRIVAEYRDLARSTRLAIEKLVKAEKDNRRNKIVNDAQEKLRAFLSGLNRFMPPVVADFAVAIKGKKSLTSMQDAVDTELARAKIAAVEINTMIDANLKTYGELASGYEASFADLGRIVNQQPDACRALIEQRIAQHKADDEKRLEAEREKIRAEERASIARQTEEKETTASPWPEAIAAAVAESAKVRQFAKEIRNAPAGSTANNAWQDKRDSVVAMLDDMTIPELATLCVEIAKIKKARTYAVS